MSMVRTRSASRTWPAHIMALGPVARCDELTDDINAVTQLNKNAHRLNLRQKHAIRNGCPSSNRDDETFFISEHLNENFNNQR